MHSLVGIVLPFERGSKMKAQETRLYKHYMMQPPMNKDGKPNHGSSIATAYWRGRDGIGIGTKGKRVIFDDKARCPYVMDSPAAYAWYAGRDTRRLLQKFEDNPPDH